MACGTTVQKDIVPLVVCTSLLAVFEIGPPQSQMSYWLVSFDALLTSWSLCFRELISVGLLSFLKTS